MKWLLSAIVLTLAPAAVAEEEILSRSKSGPLSVTLRLAPAQPVIGDRVRLSIEARAEPGVEVLMPSFGEALDRYRVVSFNPSEEVDDQGNTLARQRYTLEPSRSGPQSIPPLLVEFVDRRPGRTQAPEDQDAYELLTERIDFEVSSVLPEDAELELRPALGPLAPREVPGAALWPWMAAGAVLLALAAPFALRTLRGRLAQRRALSAYDVARGELDALLYGERPDPANMGRFFVRLSDVIRRYLEDRFGLRSPELTTEEFLLELARSPDLYAQHRDLLTAFLTRADLVKFANFVPDESGVQESIESAQLFLEDTREVAGA